MCKLWVGSHSELQQEEEEEEEEEEEDKLTERSKDWQPARSLLDLIVHPVFRSFRAAITRPK